MILEMLANYDLKIACHILCFNVDKFMPWVVENCHPYVDRIYLALPSNSWGYCAKKIKNPTDLRSEGWLAKFPKCMILDGDWETEEQMRNSCLEMARFEGFHWLVIQDADEFYAETSWILLRNMLAIAPRYVKLIKTTWYTFWKHPSLVVVNRDGSIKSTNAGFALRVEKSSYFAKQRQSNWASPREIAVVDIPCFHYGYVLSDEEMLLKLSTWGHVNDFNTQRWFSVKWINWNSHVKYLHPIQPGTWQKAIYFPGEHPPFVANIFGTNFLARDDFCNRELPPAKLVKNGLYDFQAHLKELKLALGKLCRSFQRAHY